MPTMEYTVVQKELLAEMPDFPQNHSAMERELDTYYSTYDPCTDALLEKLDKLAEHWAGVSSYEKKTQMYELLSEACPVHLFGTCDFFYEISSGRERHTWGGLQSRVGSYLHETTAPQWLDVYGDDTADDRKEGFLFCWNNPVGFDHHVPGYDRVLNLGLEGIVRDAEKRLSHCNDPRKREFYRCVIRANRALERIAERFSLEAGRLAKESGDGETRRRYERIAAAAARVPANPPATFYEGLCAVFFYREVVGSLEGIGISSFAQLDRMLYPLYAADLAAGRITKQEATDLFCQLLTYTDVRFEVHSSFNETSTTIEVGGCDRGGRPIYNAVTDIIFDAVLLCRSVNTKINCRISKAHPKAFLGRIAQVQLEDLPTVMMHNDDVLVPARVRRGLKPEDARRYVGCGCHEVVAGGSEVCTRADTWLSIPRILLETMKTSEAVCFGDFYGDFLRDVKNYHIRIETLKNRQEKRWCEFDPLVLYSSSFEASAEKGMDVTEGGARYNNTALSMVGAANAVDGLYAIRRLVFEERKLTMEEYLRVLESNFEADPALRQYILHFPRYGTDNGEINDFSTLVLEDLSHVSGRKNGRGGDYLPAFYPHDIFRPLGAVLGATPDGRLAGMALSRGASPSEFVAVDSPLSLVRSLRHIDFTAFADSFVAELTLPRLTQSEENRTVLTAIMEGFLDAEGSSLQLNLMDPALLRDAQKHPEAYPSMAVRVCGYSAVFVTLGKEVQNEVIDRIVR